MMAAAAVSGARDVTRRRSPPCYVALALARCVRAARDRRQRIPFHLITLLFHKTEDWLTLLDMLNQC